MLFFDVEPNNHLLKIHDAIKNRVVSFDDESSDRINRWYIENFKDFQSLFSHCPSIDR